MMVCELEIELEEEGFEPSSPLLVNLFSSPMPSRVLNKCQWHTTSFLECQIVGIYKLLL